MVIQNVCSDSDSYGHLVILWKEKHVIQEILNNFFKKVFLRYRRTRVNGPGKQESLSVWGVPTTAPVPIPRFSLLNIPDLVIVLDQS